MMSNVQSKSSTKPFMVPWLSSQREAAACSSVSTSQGKPAPVSPLGKDWPQRCATHVCVSQTKSGLGGLFHIYRCARQLCLLLCILQGKPGIQQLLLQQQQGRSRAGSAGRSLKDWGCGPVCALPASKGKEICTHLQLSFHTGLLMYLQSTYTSSRQMKHFFFLFSPLI